MGEGNERTMLVWRMKPTGGVEEDPVDEIKYTDEDKELATRSQAFMMRSGVAVNSLGQDTELLIMMYGLERESRFVILSQKHNKF